MGPYCFKEIIMKQYYIAVDGKQSGPYSFEELCSMGLKANTLVWRQGMENWTQAGAIDKLSPAIIGNRPGDNGSGIRHYNEENECPKQHLGLAIFAAIMFPTGIAAIVKTALIKVRWNEGRYDDARWLAKTARKYSIMSIVIGVILLAIVILYYVILITIIINAGHNSYYY